MVKKSKRKQDIKSKLLAAIAMLMVATIMMVSSTYAWFTLSTAPEVQGITTTVGANGNLEIALSPFSGDPAAVTSGVGDADKEWLLKNLTWGNLLNMSDESYGLGDITLLPSRLNFANGFVNGSALKIPVYGADGRVSELGGTVYYGAKDPTGAVAGFLANTGWGVRAVGTSSSQTPTQRNYYTALNNINTYRVSAQSAGKKALDDSGDALAAIAVKKATDVATGYEVYKDDIANMLSLLTEADKAAEKALYNVFLALASTELVQANEATAGTLYDQIKAVESMSLTNAEQYIASLGAPALQDAYDAWEGLHTDVSSANLAYDGIKNEATWNEAQITGVLSYLMNTSGDVKLGGKTLDEVKVNPMSLMTAMSKGLTLTLGENSGLFYDLAQLSGNISSTVTFADGTLIEYNGQSGDLSGMEITISASEPSNGALLKQLRAAVAVLTPAAGTGSPVSAIDTTYGYAIDLLFRTNVANSDLLLQVAGAQRVYVDSENDATMGGGSTMTFQGVYSNLDNLVDLMEGIRVVFMATQDSKLYGIAKLVDFKVSYVDGASTITGLYDTATSTITSPADSTWAAPADGTDPAVTVTAYLSLHSYEIEEGDGVSAGKLLMGDELPETAQVLCGLPQNAVQQVTALVYLDGDYVDNSDVSNSETGISMTGTMNLQFASSAVLVPMENSELRNPQNP